MSQNNNPSSLHIAKIRSLSVAGLILGALFLIPALGLAQPSTTPPGGNIDAQFDTVTVGPGLFNYFIQPGGGSDTEITTSGDIIMNPNGGLGSMLFEEAGGTGVYTMSIDSYGLENPDSNPVNVNDALRITGNGEAASSLGYGDQSFIVEDPSGSYMEFGENGIYVTGPSSAGPYGDTGIYVTNGGGNAIFAYGTGTTVMQAQGTGSLIGSFYNLTSQTSANLASSSGAAGNFSNVSTGSGAVLADNSIGVNAIGSSFGVAGEDQNNGSTGYLGYGNYGVYGNGETMGGYFRDTSNSGYAYLGYGDEGVRGYGNTRGGYFNDLNSSGYAYIAYGDRGIDATGSYTGGTFRNTSGVWADLASSSYSLITSGSIYMNSGQAYKPGGGSWAATSDIRLKDIHGDFVKGLQEILRLNPVEFNYKDDNELDLPSDEDYVGFIAQDVQDVFPEAIGEDQDGYLTFDMHTINVAVVNAIQELAALLDSNVAKLQKQIDAQQREIDALRQIVCDIKPEHAQCQ